MNIFVVVHLSFRTQAATVVWSKHRLPSTREIIIPHVLQTYAYCCCTFSSTNSKFNLLGFVYISGNSYIYKDVKNISSTLLTHPWIQKYLFLFMTTVQINKRRTSDRSVISKLQTYATQLQSSTKISPFQKIYSNPVKARMQLPSPQNMMAVSESPFTANAFTATLPPVHFPTSPCKMNILENRFSDIGNISETVSKQDLMLTEICLPCVSPLVCAQ